MFRRLFFFAAVSLAGCSNATTSPVEGLVTFDGKPLAGAAVVFVPQGAGRDATGQTDAAGRFEMSTFEPGDGVLPGTYKVTITPATGAIDTTQYASAEEAMAAASKPRAAPRATGPAFPQRYSRIDQTPLTQQVPAEGNVSFVLKTK